MTPFKRILVATDFHEPSRRAIGIAVGLARALDAEITLVHVLELPSYPYLGAEWAGVDIVTPLEDAAAKALEDQVQETKRAGVRVKGVLRRGAPWSLLLDEARDVSADVLVMGTQGRTGVSHALFGSVAEKVVRMSPIPVLTVRGP